MTLLLANAKAWRAQALSSLRGAPAVLALALGLVCAGPVQAHSLSATWRAKLSPELSQTATVKGVR